jgi:chemotaxis protein methyltransferase CheR
VTVAGARADGVPSPAALPEREFAYTQKDFEQVRALIRARVGIALNDSKQNMVYNRLVKRVRALGAASFADYLAQLGDAGHEEWQHFVNALTTNLSHFFREEYHFPILAEHVKALRRPQVRVWSAAASTGEEPYSIAMTLCEAFGSLTPPASVLGTDVDTAVLQTAERAIYSLERVEPVSPERLKRFFLQGTGGNEGYARVRPEVTRLVRFRRLNLSDTRWDFGDERQDLFDVIFCRNVMIYFDKPTQHEILQRIARVLAPDGLLFAGHSESFLHAGTLFRAVGKTVYRPIAHA